MGETHWSLQGRCWRPSDVPSQGGDHTKPDGRGNGGQSRNIQGSVWEENSAHYSLQHDGTDGLHSRRGFGLQDLQCQTASRIGWSLKTDHCRERIVMTQRHQNYFICSLLLC